MPDHAYQEWRNINSQRNFPFADDATLMSIDGITLSTSVFIDAFFYPMDITEPLYLSRINVPDNILEISADGQLVASAEMVGTVADFYDEDDRHIGTLIASDDFSLLTDEIQFTSVTAPFAAACVMAQNQPGVRGFQLPNGDIVTGEVTFQGIDGVRIDSYVSGDNQILRISAVGVQSTPECIDLSPPIECIDVNQVNNGSLMISRLDNHIILAHRSALDEVCTDKLALPDDEGNLPLQPDDPCDPPPPAPPCDPNPPWTGPGACPSDPQYYFFSAGGDLLTITPYLGAELAGSALLDYIYNPLLPPRQSQGLRIALRGQEVS